MLPPDIIIGPQEIAIFGQKFNADNIDIININGDVCEYGVRKRPGSFFRAIYLHRFHFYWLWPLLALGGLLLALEPSYGYLVMPALFLASFLGFLIWALICMAMKHSLWEVKYLTRARPPRTPEQIYWDRLHHEIAQASQTIYTKIGSV